MGSSMLIFAAGAALLSAGVLATADRPPATAVPQDSAATSTAARPWHWAGEIRGRIDRIRQARRLERERQVWRRHRDMLPFEQAALARTRPWLASLKQLDDHPAPLALPETRGAEIGRADRWRHPRWQAPTADVTDAMRRATAAAYVTAVRQRLIRAEIDDFVASRRRQRIDPTPEARALRLHHERRDLMHRLRSIQRGFPTPVQLPARRRH